MQHEEYEEKVERDIFNECFSIARTKRLVIASTIIEGVQHVCTSEGEWIPFKEIVAKHPLETLKLKKLDNTINQYNDYYYHLTVNQRFYCNKFLNLEL
ncbi:hypothetical protein [Tolypothrix sp. NIES-4075]|uniref:hypothetical protein n=1 Tax=Tolypothrix sp. NIES-4075 TaxID=2005459 RepID=UPI00117C0D49|nr:hypothetical protein [Tolypothrix sp. NIES-4075]